ncbi:MAG: SCP2 sterol-binding domain-containing protein [Myxococcales bacterium]|nr:SCP2 sterol-binding domain-containing protein [Myxococcales bacterium]
MPAANVAEIFDAHIPQKLKDKPSLQGQINAKYLFDVTGNDGGKWIVDLTQPGGVISQGGGEAPCTVTISATALLDIVNGKLKAPMAFMSGSLKVNNAGLAAKLLPLLS